MPIYIELANLIVDKESIKSKYIGGIEAFRDYYIVNGGEKNQEDNKLFSISRMNPDEFDLQHLIENGLSYVEVDRRSDDFVIVSRYGGCLWEVDWLCNNSVFAWHTDCEKQVVARLREISEMPANDIMNFEISLRDALET